MVSTWARTRARERIAAIGAEPLDAMHLRRQVLEVLGEVIGHDAYVWLLTDPVTTVGAAPLAAVPCLPELPTLIKAKYATPVNRWTTLRIQGSPTARLRDVTGGDLARSLVWREVMRRYRIADVISVVFADQFGCWGFLELWRDEAWKPFTRSDAEFIDSVATHLTTALRQCQARTFTQPSVPRQPGIGPVVLTLDDDLRITSRTASSRAWLDVLLPPEPDGRAAVPASVYNVAAQLLAAEAGVDEHPASTRVHLAGGLWLTLRAARLSSDEPAAAPVPAPGPAQAPGPGPAPRPPQGSAGPATIVVTIEEVSAAGRLDLFARAFGLTGRETQLLSLLATGSDTRAMARQMSVSEHTIQDHLKSIFAKTGARDRVAVLSRALGTRPGKTS
jgi:DNA-binding CsgD family transcriptional regulator